MSNKSETKKKPKKDKDDDHQTSLRTPLFISQKGYLGIKEKAGVYKIKATVKDRLDDYLKAFTKKTLVTSTKIAKENKRKTIKEDDVSEALNRLEQKTVAKLIVR